MWSGGTLWYSSWNENVCDALIDSGCLCSQDGGQESLLDQIRALQSSPRSPVKYVCDALHDFVPFVQLKI